MLGSDLAQSDTPNLVRYVGCDLGVLFALARTLSSPNVSHQSLVPAFSTALGSVGQEQCRWLREHLRQMVGDATGALAHHCMGLLGSCIATPAAGKEAAKYLGSKAKSFLIRSPFSRQVARHAVQVLTVEAVNEEGMDSFDKVLSGKLRLGLDSQCIAIRFHACHRRGAAGASHVVSCSPSHTSALRCTPQRLPC